MKEIRLRWHHDIVYEANDAAHKFSRWVLAARSMRAVLRNECIARNVLFGADTHWIEERGL